MVSVGRLFILAVYVQWLGFIILYEDQGYVSRFVDGLKKYFTAVSLLFVALLISRGYQIAIYKSHHFLTYIGLCLFAVNYFKEDLRFNEALSLGFILVFFNSFLWEFPIHMEEWVNKPWTLAKLQRMTLQLVHVLPGLWLFQTYTWIKPISWYTSKIAIIWSMTSVYVYFWTRILWYWGHPELNVYTVPIMVFIRVVSLIILCEIVKKGSKKI